jgi:hypothetical protein
VRRLYAVNPESLQEVDRWLAPFRAFWAPRLEALGTELARGRRARRVEGSRHDGARHDSVRHGGAQDDHSGRADGSA